jgi:hypothetical protein
MPILGTIAAGSPAPSAPTIGTATDGGTGTSVSVAFTASSYIGKGTITYTATSSPSGITATGSSSPITVSGLTTGTAYTFTVVGNTNYGVASAASASSNSVTPVAPIVAAFDSIATVTVGAGGATYVEFASIPQTYKHLQIRGTTRATAGTLNYEDVSQLNFNDVFSAQYADSYNYATGTGAIGIDAEANRSFIRSFDTPRNGSAANVFGFGITDIIDYASTTKLKSVQWTSGAALPGAQGRGAYIGGTGLYRSTNAITKIRITAYNTAFAQYSQFALYGIKG